MVTLADIRQNRDTILHIARTHGADNLRIFGSVVRGTATEASDIDVLVRMSPESSLLDRIAIMQDLEDLLCVKVDVVNENALHKSIYQSVLKEAVPL